MHPACQSCHIQVFDANNVEFVHQAARERMHCGLTRVSYLRMRPCHPYPLLLTPAAPRLTSGKTTLLLS